MNRYPHTIVILKHTNEHNPYKDDEYEEVYSGECNCYAAKYSAIPSNGIGVKEFVVAIPNSLMPEIGCNYKVLVNMNNGLQDREYDYVGFVTDFNRYSRVCEVRFQMAKDEVLEEDLEV